MKKKIFAVILCVAMLAIAVVSGTMAYFTDSKAVTNTMTVGSVKIEQIEQERDENGNLVDFTQDKPIVPSVGKIEWADEKLDVNGIDCKVFAPSVKNVIDKIVTVKNVGKSAAYIRTIVVLEAPDYDAKDLIHVNVNDDSGVVSYTEWAPVDIDGVQYVYSVFTYDSALAPNAISAPSLVQVFLDSATTNEDAAAYGETWDILVLSQAVQADGFGSAAEALNEAFGEATATNVAGWFAE